MGELGENEAWGGILNLNTWKLLMQTNIEKQNNSRETHQIPGDKKIFSILKSLAFTAF